MDSQELHSYEILLRLPRGVRADDGQLGARLAKANNRQKHPDPNVEALVNKTWENKLREKGEGVLWNSTKFRFASCVEEERKKSDLRKAVMLLGITDYREYVGSNLVSDRPLQVFGSEDYLANAFGNCCIVRTKDAKIAIVERSAAVGEGDGFLVFPGGHPEPSQIGIKDLDQPMEDVGEQAVLDELFNSGITEAFEELSTDPDDMYMDTYMCIGIAKRTHACKSQMVFTVECKRTSLEIQSSWEREAEISSLIFVGEEQVQQIASTGTLDGKQFMPEHLGAAELYILYANRSN